MTENNFNEKFWEKEGHPQNVPIHTSDEDKDLFYMGIAKSAAARSKCASRGIGAILVKDDNILSWGCNGSPPGVNLCQDASGVCPRQEAGYPSGEGLHLCPAQHAERNAILQAAKHGIATNEAMLYCYCGLPCMECWKAIICAGIKRVVYIAKESASKFERDVNGNLTAVDQEGHLIRYDDLSVVLANQSGIQIDSYSEQDVKSFTSKEE